VRIIVGLGNPGSEYTLTRHNVGFSVINAIVEKTGAVMKPGKGEYVYASIRVNGQPVLLVKPMTYMNNSGLAVQDVIEYYHALPEELLIILDDFSLPLGTIRIRERGSDGGHNGLYSIIYQLRSEEIPRLRCGIASDTMPVEKWKMADFVLTRFERSEQPKTEQMIFEARDAALMTVGGEIQNVMTLYNKKKLN
jgi:peptidyl-tRNA hydrolase, PTH1 family